MHRQYTKISCNNWKSKVKKKQKTVSFKMSKKMKYFGINPVKSVQYLCAENYESLTKVINEDVSEW